MTLLERARHLWLLALANSGTLLTVALLTAIMLEFPTVLLVLLVMGVIVVVAIVIAVLVEHVEAWAKQKLQGPR